MMTFDVESWIKFCNTCIKATKKKKRANIQQLDALCIEDHNNVELLLKIKYALKTMYLVAIMFFISFFMAMGWHKFLDLEVEIYKWYWVDDPTRLDAELYETFDSFFLEHER